MGHSQRFLVSIIAVMVFSIILPLIVSADVPQLINFQGKLIEDDVAVTGFRSMTFSLWDSDTGGAPASAIWSETQTAVDIIEGIYNVQLGSVNSLPSDLYTYDQLYLQIDIIHPTEGSQRLSPLLELTSTVFALKAGDADMLDGNTADAFAQGVHNHSGSDITTGVVADARIANTIARDSEITWNNLGGVPADFADGVDNTGITSETDPTVTPSVKDGVSWGELSGIPAGFADGVDNDSGGDITGVIAGTGLSGGGTSGDVTLDVDIPFSLSGSASWSLISGYNSASDGTGLYGESSYYGIWGYSTGSDYAGVHGTSTNGIGVRGYSNNNYGVYGINATSGNYGYIGSSQYGLYGEASGGTGRGVYGIATATGDTKNYGGYFVAAGDDGVGVFGWGTGADSRGVSGYTAGSTARAVYGRADGSQGYGGYFFSTGGSSRAIYAQATGANSYGGYFWATNTTATGIFAHGGPSGYAADFQGKVKIRNWIGDSIVMELGEGLDYAEGFDVSDQEKHPVSPGSVLVIDSENPGTLKLSSIPYDRKVAGIVAGAKGLGSGVRLGVGQFDCDVALAGRVYCNVDATETEIKPGDLLTTSSTPGHAMKTTDYALAQGAILGKAMQSLDKGQKGQILVLVTLQ